jgi:succinyl-CoA synthetase beta subunit
MKIHEYQAKEVLASFGIPVPRGRVAFTPQDAAAIHDDLGVKTVVVKAQIHAGGRGKAGGVKLAHSRQETLDAAKAIMSKPLVTHQTGPGGQLARRVLVEEASEIARELYLGMAIDRSLGRPVLMASTEGGVEIEEVARRTPEKILRETVDPAFGLQGFQARRLAFALGLPAESVNAATNVMVALAKAFVQKDCSLAEINPLILTKDGRVVALDAKLNFDQNALYRHKDLSGYRDLDEEDPREVEASKYGLSYISLNGNIGCMVNGAGLAMATMDIIKLHGGEPANFLDVGGGATTEQVTNAFRIILSDEKVKGILVNIFGGIMKCDVIAQGIIAAARGVGLKAPLVVRLEGTNVEQGKALLKESGLPLTTASTMDEGARLIVRAVQGR